MIKRDREVPRFRIDAQEIVDLTGELVKKETINPPGNEYLTKDIILNSLRRLGAKVSVFGHRKRPSILGEIGKGNPSLAIIAHMDVVPPGKGWREHPFEPLVRSGRIYGRGVVDNKGPYAAAWAAVKAAVEYGLPRKGKIILGAVSDEERGSEEGIKLLLKKGFHPDFCLIPDGGKINQAIIGEKGMLWVKLESRGKQAHGSSPSQGTNAIEKLSRFILRLRSSDFGKNYHSRFTKTTLNWGEMKGGEAPNIVPGRCEATLDIRYPLGLTKNAILRKIREEIREFKRRDSRADIRIKEAPLQTQPHLVGEDSEMVRAFLRAADDIRFRLTLKTMGGNTIAKEFYFAGIPSLNHSPEEGESSAHRINESVKIDNLVKCARLWATFLWELTG
ncbi:ArgE/DapE family deacylase [candidate division NPL-UPA2 bacterium]|nr:ArgE/DapE family deacylase [candidate division NPL-UPA2 bacterium]